MPNEDRGRRLPPKILAPSDFSPPSCVSSIDPSTYLSFPSHRLVPTVIETEQLPPSITMADNNAVKEAEASMANLLLDEVTGEKVSKSELKRRQKNREKEAKKKEKEAAAPPKAEKKTSAEDEEANLTPNVSHSLPIRR